MRDTSCSSRSACCAPCCPPTTSLISSCRTAWSGLGSAPGRSSKKLNFRESEVFGELPIRRMGDRRKIQQGLVVAETGFADDLTRQRLPALGVVSDHVRPDAAHEQAITQRRGKRGFGIDEEPQRPVGQAAPVETGAGRPQRDRQHPEAAAGKAAEGGIAAAGSKRTAWMETGRISDVPGCAEAARKPFTGGDLSSLCRGTRNGAESAEAPPAPSNCAIEHDGNGRR